MTVVTLRLVLPHGAVDAKTVPRTHDRLLWTGLQDPSTDAHLRVRTHSGVRSRAHKLAKRFACANIPSAEIQKPIVVVQRERDPMNLGLHPKTILSRQS